MRYLLIPLLFFFVTGVSAQERPADKKLIQFSGIITDADSNNVVPYVTITNLSNNDQMYAANYKGYFSFIAHPGDSLLYTAVGYSKATVHLPMNIKGDSYTKMVKLKLEITYLPTVKIYPWATVEDFTKDFLSMKIADDDVEIAKRNLSYSSINGMMQTLPRDAGEISNINWRYNHDRALNKNMVQTNPLLNPFAWGKLMQLIFNGDKVRKEEN
jgi:hypothetical protein